MFVTVTKLPDKRQLLSLSDDSNSNKHDVYVNCFEPAYLREKNYITRTAKGRGTVYFFNIDGRSLVLRHYYRGGLVGKFNRDKFFYTGQKHTRAYQEIDILFYLLSNKMHVPKPVAAMVSRQGLSYSADIITEEISGHDELHERLMQAPLSELAWQLVGENIAQLHKLQVCHYDINVKNILITKSPKQRDDIALLDFDKAVRRLDDKWQQANLARFKRSLLKQQSRHAQYHFNDACWQALMQGYLANR